jgi:hypothetical protein
MNNLMQITNLDELRKNSSEYNISTILTEYVTELIVFRHIMKKLLNYIDSENDTTTITIKELKTKLDGFSIDANVLEE